MLESHKRLHTDSRWSSRCFPGPSVVSAHVASRSVSASFPVLSSTLDLLDLSEPGDRKNRRDKKNPLSLGNAQKNNKKSMDETELIQVEVEQTGRNNRTPEKAPPDAGRSWTFCLLQTRWAYHDLSNSLIKLNQKTSGGLSFPAARTRSVASNPGFTHEQAKEKGSQAALMRGSHLWRLSKEIMNDCQLKGLKISVKTNYAVWEKLPCDE